MRSSVTKSLAVVGVSAVAVFGAQYASAAQGGATNNAHHTVAPLRNIDYQYTAHTAGGTGEAVYSLSNPPKGLYEASFTANFYPEGSPAAPVAFSCSLVKDGSTMRAQSTSASSWDSGYYIGVNASNVIKIDDISSFQVYCGTSDGSSWSWGTRPLQVNLVRVDGLQQGSLSGGAPKKHGDLTMVGTR